jgi:hypothetical protein
MSHFQAFYIERIFQGWRRSLNPHPAGCRNRRHKLYLSALNPFLCSWPRRAVRETAPDSAKPQFPRMRLELDYAMIERIIKLQNRRV